MRDGFSRALKAVLVHEGGQVDHPEDPGGRTNQGVTKRVYDGYRARTGLATRDVWLMTPTERDDIYRRQYWDIVKGDQLPPGIDYVVFDGAVNSGPGQSVKWLQRALGSRYTGKVDGVVGSVTLAAVDAHPDHDILVAEICKRRMAFLRALKTWKTFGRGWTARVKGVQALGQAWAMGKVGPPVTHTRGGEAKANIEDAKPAPGTGVADAVTGAGGVTGGGATAGDDTPPVEAIKETVEQAQEQLSPFAYLSDWASHAMTALAVLGVACVLGGLAYRVWAKRAAAKRADALDLGDTHRVT